MGRDLSDPLTSCRVPLVDCSRPTPGAQGLGRERFLCFCRTPFWGGHFPVSSHVPVPSPCPQFIQQTCFHHQTDARLAPSPGNIVTRSPWPCLHGGPIWKEMGWHRGWGACPGGPLEAGAVDRDISEEGGWVCRRWVLQKDRTWGSTEDVCGCQWETGQVE